MLAEGALVLFLGLRASVSTGNVLPWKLMFHKNIPLLLPPDTYLASILKSLHHEILAPFALALALNQRRKTMAANPEAS